MFNSDHLYGYLNRLGTIIMGFFDVYFTIKHFRQEIQALMEQMKT